MTHIPLIIRLLFTTKVLTKNYTYKQEVRINLGVFATIKSNGIKCVELNNEAINLKPDSITL